MQIKMTEHFLEKAAKHIRFADRNRLWQSMVDGRLEAAARSLPEHLKGAVCLGSSWMVFCVDRNDGFVVALITALSADACASIKKRRDTVITSLEARARETIIDKEATYHDPER